MKHRWSGAFLLISPYGHSAICQEGGKSQTKRAESPMISFGGYIENRAKRPARAMTFIAQGIVLGKMAKRNQRPARAKVPNRLWFSTFALAGRGVVCGAVYPRCRFAYPRLRRSLGFQPALFAFCRVLITGPANDYFTLRRGNNELPELTRLGEAPPTNGR